MKTLRRFGRVVARKDGHNFKVTFEPLLGVIAGDPYYISFPGFRYRRIGNYGMRKALYRSKGRILYAVHTRYELSCMDWRANNPPYKIRMEAYA